MLAGHFEIIYAVNFQIATSRILFTTCFLLFPLFIFFSFSFNSGFLHFSRILKLEGLISPHDSKFSVLATWPNHFQKNVDNELDGHCPLRWLCQYSVSPEVHTMPWHPGLWHYWPSRYDMFLRHQPPWEGEGEDRLGCGERMGGQEAAPEAGAKAQAPWAQEAHGDETPDSWKQVWRQLIGFLFSVNSCIAESNKGQIKWFLDKYK